MITRHRGVADLTTFDPREVALSYRARAQVALGFLERASQTAQQAVAHARHRGHPADLCYALLHAASVHTDADEIEQAASMIREMEHIAHQHGLAFYTDALIPMQRAVYALRCGRVQEAEAGFSDAMDRWKSAGEGIVLPILRALHAYSAALLGKHDLAASLLDEALTQIAMPGWEERCYEAEVVGMKGWVLSLKGDHRAAEQHYRLSLDVAGKQRARLFELHAATNYARLLKERNRCTFACLRECCVRC